MKRLRFDTRMYVTLRYRSIHMNFLALSSNICNCSLLLTGVLTEYATVASWSSRKISAVSSNLHASQKLSCSHFMGRTSEEHYYN